MPLDHVLDLYEHGRPTGTPQNEYGEVDVSDSLVSDGHLAHVEHLTASEQDLEERMAASERVAIYVRYDPDIRVDRWFVCRDTGHRWDIKTVVDWDYKGEWMATTAMRAIAVPEVP